MNIVIAMKCVNSHNLFKIFKSSPKRNFIGVRKSENFYSSISNSHQSSFTPFRKSKSLLTQRLTNFKLAATDGGEEFDPVVKGNETVSDVPTGFVNSLEKTIIVEKKKLKLEEKNELNGELVLVGWPEGCFND
jgi:hypothetical protein